jgi:hypothetical protein
MRDGKTDWTPEALAANANVFLDDFLLFDEQADYRPEPPRDREKHDQRSSLCNRRWPHDRRKLDRHLAHLAVNRDREFCRAERLSDQARQEVFPYFASRTRSQTVTDSVELAEEPDVWR